LKELSSLLLINKKKRRKKGDLTERSNIFERFRDLSEGELTKIAHDRCL
jgi:hypothetical protein